MYVGRMASCASCAPFALVLYCLTFEYSSAPDTYYYSYTTENTWDITEFELQNYVANIYTKENGQYKKVE